MIFILIEKVKIEKIKGAEYNPRKDLQETDKKYNEIKNSLETFGIDLKDFENVELPEEENPEEEKNGN